MRMVGVEEEERGSTAARGWMEVEKEESRREVAKAARGGQGVIATATSWKARGGRSASTEGSTSELQGF